MNILIITPTHPTQIAEFASLHKQYKDIANIISPQMLALVYEETFGNPYQVVNTFFVDAFKKNPKKMFKKTYNDLIVYGNLDKDTDINFDVIVSYAAPFMDTEEIFDKYLDAAEEQLKNTDAPRINWYKPEDAQYKFPTLQHLMLFLDKLLKRKEDNSSGTDTVQ